MASIMDNTLLTANEAVIRLPRFSDASKIVQYFTQNKAFLKPWEPRRSESFFTLQGWQQRLLQLAKLQQHELAFYFLIFADASQTQLVGTISFSHVSYHPAYCANVGYSLAEHAQGKGIMQTSLAATCEYLFSQYNLHRISASYMPRNKRSARVLTAVGFEPEGLAKDYLLINDRWEDHILTALINPAWQG